MLLTYVAWETLKTLASVLMAIILYLISWEGQGFKVQTKRFYNLRFSNLHPFLKFGPWSSKKSHLSAHLAQIFARQLNMIKLRKISCCKIVRCSCAVESVILLSSIACFKLFDLIVAKMVKLWSNIIFLGMFYPWENYKKSDFSCQWLKTSFRASIKIWAFYAFRGRSHIT